MKMSEFHSHYNRYRDDQGLILIGPYISLMLIVPPSLGMNEILLQTQNRLVDNHVDVSVPISMSLVSPFECLTTKPKAIIWWLQETFSQENL